MLRRGECLQHHGDALGDHNLIDNKKISYTYSENGVQYYWTDGKYHNKFSMKEGRRRELLPFPWAASHDRPGSVGQSPPRVRLAMAMSASGP